MKTYLLTSALSNLLYAATFSPWPLISALAGLFCLTLCCPGRRAWSAAGTACLRAAVRAYYHSRSLVAFLKGNDKLAQAIEDEMEEELELIGR